MSIARIGDHGPASSLKSARVIVVAAHSKPGAVVFVRLCPIEVVDVVVTDTDVDPILVAALREAEVEVIVA